MHRGDVDERVSNQAGRADQGTGHRRTGAADAPERGSYPSHTPFEQPWWLEAVAPGRWGHVLVERGGEVVARLPYVRKQKFGLTVLTQAPLTRFVGPWLRPSEGKYEKRLGVERELMGELIDRLPPHDVYRGNFAPAITNWLPFHWAGFDATVRYTYRIDDLRDPDRLWAELGGNVRSRVKRAAKGVEIRTDLESEAVLEEVLRINRRLFERQGLGVSFGDDLARRLDAACRARGAREVVTATDSQGRLQAALYLVRDATTTYLLYGGTDPEFRSTGVNSLVVWEAIRLASQTSQHFDFLGSMIEPVERVNRSFGARQVPYFFVTRARPRARAVFAARRGVRVARREVRRGAERLQRRLHGTQPPPADGAAKGGGAAKGSA
ncbi:GNAT family N-acetyltransferase [Pseudonocardia sp.]|uniref:GNAT family N-acetyltransferase n=1 Tax=Pseudonocardia sp. TaxID=60912 RepID=UPI003D10F1EA